MSFVLIYHSAILMDYQESCSGNTVKNSKRSERRASWLSGKWDLVNAQQWKRDYN